MAENGSDTGRRARPTPRQLAYLKRGLDQPGGKLPLFDEDGQRIDPRTVKACLAHGWAKPWAHNPIKPDWLICRLTEAGRRLAQEAVRGKRVTAARASHERSADSLSREHQAPSDIFPED